MDLNADLGEEVGDDDALLAIVTSANVAAGGHAGGGVVLERTVLIAAERHVAVGAHPSYPDRQGFGRVSRAAVHDSATLRRIVREQVLVVATACLNARSAMAHVKAHGALYNDAAELPQVADAFVAAVADARHELGLDAGTWAVMGMPGTVLESACRAAGTPFVAEAFADRAYTATGALVPRSQPGAVVHDAAQVAARVRQLAVDGTVTAADGSLLPLRADSLCVHGDTPGAVEIARTVRRVLEEEGVTVARWAAR